MGNVGFGCCIRNKSLSRFEVGTGQRVEEFVGEDNGSEKHVSGGVGRGARHVLIKPAPAFIWGLSPKVNQGGHQEHSSLLKINLCLCAPSLRWEQRQ